MIRVLIADDSLLVRQVLTDILEESGEEIAVIGYACNGKEAAERTVGLKPDLVIMDLVMPGVDGMEGIEKIMANTPTPVLVLSAALEGCEGDQPGNAIRRGALDVMLKPDLGAPGALRVFSQRLIEKVKVLGGIKVTRHPRRKPSPPRQEETRQQPSVPPKILAIGASTGGPRAVMTLLRELPANFPASVFVVQHIAHGFAAGFATWLDRECALPVRVAEDGDRFLPGLALVAPDGCHMTVSDGKIKLVQGEPVNCCRPSIDVFFNSLAEQKCNQVVSLLLSGMGKDGAQGLLRIREQGGTTLVQDEGSCAVFGMPKAAIGLRAADQVLPLDRMPSAISRLFALA
ncbi:chemotaxis-specific protein-glutamate methyltransferase CheB [Geomonas sp. Red276]